MRNAEHGKTEHAKTEHIRLPSDASWTTSTSSESATASSTPAAAEVRASSRPDALDHRLASLRVRVERVDPDGTIRVRLLELAATASGEDNALLILPQSVWQELKRHT
jgi:hypothetical protein